MTFFSCPLCASTNNSHFAFAHDFEYGTSDLAYNYLECSECLCIFIVEPPVNSLDLIYPNNYYSQSNNLKSKFSIRGLLNLVKTFLDNRFFSYILRNLKGNNLTVLDVGGGSGWLLNNLKKIDSRVANTVVVDLCENSRDIAESNGHHYICSPFESTIFTEYFDLIFMLNLIEHVSNPKYVLQKAYDNMNDGCLLVIKTPNTNSLCRSIFQSRYWGGLHAPRHWVIFNKNNFSNLAIGAGFSIFSFSYTQGAPQWVASIYGSFIIHDLDASRISPVDSRLGAQLLSLFFALFDFITLAFFKTNQMVFILKK